MNVPFNDLHAQYLTIKEEIDSAIFSVIHRSDFIKGTEVGEFENAFAEYCGGGHCAGVGNGTDAITLALHALNIQPGDEIIVPAQSFIATIEPIILLGAKPVFVDIREDDYTIDARQIRGVITEKTKAIMVVHLYGHVAEMDVINQIAKENDLFVMEDCAQAHGAKYQNQVAGSFGDIATFSFFPGKNLGAFGDAGGVFSRNKALIDKVKCLRDHGRPEGEKFDHALIGYNSRLDTLQAAILKVKLKYLEAWTRDRQAYASAYTQRLQDRVKTPRVSDQHSPVYHLYVIEVEGRDRIREQLQEKGISTGLHYPQILTQHTAVKSLYGDMTGQFPVAENAVKKILSLPLFPGMGEARLHYVCQAVEEILMPVTA